MSYDIYDENGFVLSGPSINGLKELKSAVKKKNAGLYPQMASILKYGYATSPIRLKQECVELSKAIDSKDVKSTLIELGKAAAKSQTIVILHDHLSSR